MLSIITRLEEFPPTSYLDKFPWFDREDVEKLMNVSVEYIVEPSLILVIQDLYNQGIDNEGYIFNCLNFRDNGRPSSDDLSIMTYKKYLNALEAVKIMWGTEIPLKEKAY